MTENIEIEEFNGTDWVKRDWIFKISDDSKIAEDDVDSDMRNIASLLVYYGEAAGRLKAEVERKKADLDKISAILAKKYRIKSDTKLTNDQVKELVITDQLFIDAHADSTWSQLKQVRVESWYQALKRKTDVIIALTYKHTAEIKKLY